MFRKILFWTHLTCGVAAGLVIAMMSFTGVILTYERQLVEWAERDLRAEPPAGAARLPLDALVAAVRAGQPGFEPTSISVSADPAAPVQVSAGRAASVYVNGYSGEVLGEGAVGLREFFRTVTGWHRWFNAEGDSRAPWRAITGASNLAFLFLILSGLYLWLPRTWKWAMFRARLLFNPNATTGQARDYNWHHVIGIWTAIPLAVVVATATVFSYSWANDLLYRSFGEEPPARGRGGPPPAVSASESAAAGRITPAPGSMLSPDALLARAAEHVDEWRRITMDWPVSPERGARFTIDRGNGGQPQKRHTLVLDPATGGVTSWEPFDSQTPGRQARSWVRFLHTGEALGIVGQTIAGLVSLTSLVMVWTGLALAYRRLVAAPLKRRRAARAAARVA
ncbi:MAG TPA: PepSY-associated TM helix domain-containing protein [Gammaproteobacteria bacterium]